MPVNEPDAKILGDPSAPTGQRGVAEKVTANCGASCRLPWDQPVKFWYHMLLARDLEIMKSLDYQRLSGQVIEVKKMLASFIYRLRTGPP